MAQFDPSMSALPTRASTSCFPATLFSFASSLFVHPHAKGHDHASTNVIDIPTVSEQVNEAKVEKHTVKIEQKSSDLTAKIASGEVDIHMNSDATQQLENQHNMDDTSKHFVNTKRDSMSDKHKKNKIKTKTSTDLTNNKIKANIENAEYEINEKTNFARTPPNW